MNLVFLRNINVALSSLPALVFCVVALLPVLAEETDDIAGLLETIGRVGSQGVGSAMARTASDQLAELEIEILPELLAAMNTPDIVAANWYRTVYERIVFKELEQEDPDFPTEWLQEFIRDASRHGRTRRLVVQLVEELTPGYYRSILPTLLDDTEFRSEAVEFVLDRGTAFQNEGDTESAKLDFQAALKHAREVDQITFAADRLQALGFEFDIARQMGFITRWYVVGPFDAPGKSGFDKRFPPEESIDLAASYVGVDRSEIQWNILETKDRLGQINFVQAIAPTAEAVCYVYTELDSPQQQEVQMRCGADDNLSVWLNGENICSRRQWLNGTRLDRFSVPALLRKGRNRLLVKVCQGPQHQDPTVTNNWSMRLRFCDPSGAGVILRSALPESTE